MNPGLGSLYIDRSALRHTHHKPRESGGCTGWLSSVALSSIFVASNFVVPYLASRSVSPGENRPFSRRFPTINALPPMRALLIVRIQWKTAHRRPRLFLNLRFTLRAAAPMRKGKPGLHRLLQFLVVLHVLR